MPTLTLTPHQTIHYHSINPQGTRTVLLLHGLGACGESWGLQVPALVQAGFHVIAPDIRGFGQSSYPGGKLSIPDMANDMQILLRTLGKTSANVAGISMGGAIALQLALDAAEMVDRLILVSTFARLRVRRPDVLVYFGLRFLLVYTLGLETQAKAVARRIFPLPTQGALRDELVREIIQADPQGYRAAMRALIHFDVVDRLPELRMPVLIVTGERDTTVPRETQGSLARRIQTASHVVIPDAGHAVIADQPEIFNRLLIEFLCN